MTEIRPFRGLRYDPKRVSGDEVIAPPYDVVGAEAVATLHARSPYNAAHLENPAGSERERFDGAARLLKSWTSEAVLKRDARPAYYVYEQRAKIQGRTVSRRSFFARCRLHRPEAGILRPHEATLSGPREERLRLIRATRTNISPIFSTFVDAEHRAANLLAEVAKREPDFEARDALGDRHRLWSVTATAEVATLTEAVAGSNVTIADGHHRTHTALDYRDERAKASGRRWTGNEPENFVLMGLIPEDDPGLVILPIHRLLKSDGPPERFFERVSGLYRIEALAGGSPKAIEAAWQRVSENALGPTTFAVLGAEGPQSIHLLTARSQQAIDSAMPQGISAASKGLDALVLTQTVLTPLFGIDRAAMAAGRVEFTESHEEAAETVGSGHARLAFLINATRVEQIREVADAFEVMPQKTTYFYPKLATGMVYNPLD
ncbi:MAG: DUF1015 domain-containing protein [Chloroflexi bacterium]|nr:DUF1015 domain-containing protein [Chloroflexota bacterium]MDA1239417.1 DUF1015 domain-containing protein [Chloroflexota bacterium]